MTCLARYEVPVALHNYDLRCKAASRREQHLSKALLAVLKAPRSAYSVAHLGFTNYLACSFFLQKLKVMHPGNSKITMKTLTFMGLSFRYAIFCFWSKIRKSAFLDILGNSAYCNSLIRYLSACWLCASVFLSYRLQNDSLTSLYVPVIVQYSTGTEGRYRRFPKIRFFTNFKRD